MSLTRRTMAPPRSCCMSPAAGSRLELELNDGTIARVEAERFAINFRYHGHDPAKADFILACYSKSESLDGVPVVAANKLWVWDPAPSESLPPGPLTSVELRMLGAVEFMGGVAVSALSDPFPGDQQLWLLLSPDGISRLLRRADDSLMSVMSPTTKEFLKKHHHVLLAAGISSEGVEALTSLRARSLIKYRPLPYLAALMDGGLTHRAWLPTEVSLTEQAKTRYGDTLRGLLFAEQKFEEAARTIAATFNFDSGPTSSA